MGIGNRKSQCGAVLILPFPIPDSPFPDFNHEILRKLAT